MPKSTNPLLYFRAATKKELDGCEKFSGPYNASEIHMIPVIVQDAERCGHAIYFSLRRAGRKTSVTILLKRMALKKISHQPITDFFMTLTEEKAKKIGAETRAKISNFNDAYSWIIDTLKAGQTPILIEKNGEITGGIIKKKTNEKSTRLKGK